MNKVQLSGPVPHVVVRIHDGDSWASLAFECCVCNHLMPDEWGRCAHRRGSTCTHTAAKRQALLELAQLTRVHLMEMGARFV